MAVFRKEDGFARFGDFPLERNGDSSAAFRGRKNLCAVGRFPAEGAFFYACWAPKCAGFLQDVQDFCNVNQMLRI